MTAFEYSVSIEKHSEMIEREINRMADTCEITSRFCALKQIAIFSPTRFVNKYLENIETHTKYKLMPNSSESFNLPE